MDAIRFSVSRPVTVAVGVILVVMFGLIGVRAIPIQLTPTVDQPEIKVTTEWPGRSPEEIVDEITRGQEEELKNVENLKRMRSTSSEGQVEIILEFYIGADVARALQEVSDSLRQVSEYPPDVEEPTIQASSGASENAIAWIIVELTDEGREKYPHFDISTLYSPLDNEVKPFLERIAGVAEVNIYGGREREMRILVDLDRLAQYSLNHLDLLTALRSENTNVSAGTIAEGKRDYRVRVLGQYEGTQDIMDTIVAYREGGPVYIRDIATVELDYVKRRGFVRSMGNEAIAINIIRQSGANVMDIMAEVRDRLDEIETEVLPNLHAEVGPDLNLRQVYDETIYITSAISLVSQNLWVGGLIAAVVLLLFLRSFIATGVIALAIPISVIGTFLVLLALGRTLNVISLAGLAFAVGMVVDNAIVVLENIFRHRNMGKSPINAAYDGGREVWGAILASTLTTVAVFVPVLTVQEEAGQLFRDISLAIVSSVSLSLIVSALVIPAACSRWLGRPKPDSERNWLSRMLHSLFGLAPLARRGTELFAKLIHWMITGWRAWTLRPGAIVALAGLSIGGALTLAPPLDYLPAGNRNLVFGGLLIPPGYSVGQKEQVAEIIESQVGPYMEVDPADTATVQSLPTIARPMPGASPYDGVPVDNFFVGAFGDSMFSGATSAIPEVVRPLGTLLTNAFNSVPDTFGGAQQSSLFGRGVGGGNTIDLEISGPDLEQVKAAATRLFNELGQDPRYGYRALRPEPSNFMLLQPEMQVRVTHLGTELGLRTEDVGTAVRALFDGAFVGDFRTGDDTIDIRLLPEGGRLRYKEQLASVNIATPRGPVVPLDSVVEVREGRAPQSVQRIEELPSVTLKIQPPDGVPLEEVMAELRSKYVEPLRADGMIDRTMRVRFEGTAAKLDEVRTALMGDLSGEAPSGLGRGIGAVGLGLLAISGVVAVLSLVRSVRKQNKQYFYGALGYLLVGVTVTGIILLFGTQPQLLTARLIWALAVTYLLMCALFESFVYPFVIMFSVPLAIVGGFLGLSIVHSVTMANPVIATQNLDVLTMLGFIILIGVVVNNAILIVHQSLNLMTGQADTQHCHHEAMRPMEAIAEAVRTRVRPVFMSTLTSVGGMLPLVLFPGAGSELYRGLGSVVVGGLLVSTVFTLLLVPLLFSLVVEMTEGMRALRGLGSAFEKEPPPPEFDDVAAPAPVSGGVAVPVPQPVRVPQPVGAATD
ncbi:MAG: efflux RND transporter permease subunit [Planctomycetota bacterium]